MNFINKIKAYTILFVVHMAAVDELAFDLWIYKATNNKLNLLDRIVALTSPWWILREEMWASKEGKA